MSYVFNQENGLPITSWYDDKGDNELYQLSPLLEFLSNVSDVRKYIPKMVENNTISYVKANNVINAYNLLVKKTSSNYRKKSDEISSKEVNLKLVSSNYASSIVNNEIEPKTAKSINAFRSGGNLSNISTVEKKKNKNSTIKPSNDINVSSSVANFSSPLNFSIKSIEKVKKTNKYTTNNQFKKKANNNLNKIRPLTSSVAHHIRELSLKEREKTKLSKPMLYKSPSSQAIIVTSSTSTHQKSIQFSFNKQTPKNNIHPISLYSQKWSRPKSTGRIENLHLGVYKMPKTPKLQEKKNSFSPLDDALMKRRLSNTSRHIEHKSITLNSGKMKVNMKRKATPK